MFRTFIAALLSAIALNAFAVVDANRATQAELESVRGIGPGLSTRILQAREQQSFKDWNDMVERVGGIGHGNAPRFSQAGLTVGGSTYDPALKPAPQAKRGADKAVDAKAVATKTKAVPSGR